MAKINAKIRRQLNREIYLLVEGLHNEIPLGGIFESLKGAGLVALQEDHTQWCGFLTGRDGRVLLPLALFGSADEEGIFWGRIDNAALWMSWHKFETGRYEIVAYIS